MAKSLAQKAAEKGLNIHTVRARIRYGWSEHKALNTPVRQNKANTEDDLPCAIKPVSRPIDPMDRFDDLNDRVILFFSIGLIAFAVAGLAWMLLK